MPGWVDCEESVEEALARLDLESKANAAARKAKKAEAAAATSSLKIKDLKVNLKKNYSLINGIID